jgi:glycosyltransferase involved in cell wall biosynthesis
MAASRCKNIRRLQANNTGMKKLRIAIVGTRGVPNHYGGYEQATEFLSTGLVKKGYAVTVYNSSSHLYQEKNWNGVEIIHCYDPEDKIGTAGQFIYDFNCIRDARKKNYDAILLMGYTSSSVWGKLYPKKSVIISNMDGLEWKRSKYSKPVQKFLNYAEKLAVKYSDFLLADSVEIQSYLQDKYKTGSRYIPYGANVYSNESEELLKQYAVRRYNYYLVIARMVPENNIEIILDGFTNIDSDKKFLVLGNIDNKHGKYLQQKFHPDERILFPGAVYDQQTLQSLRAFTSLYFHGHSVGGTNPSLLEAMASKALIVAHENAFNKAILGDDACYFRTAEDVAAIIMTGVQNDKEKMICNNLQKIKKYYSWDTIVDQYEEYILQCINQVNK